MSYKLFKEICKDCGEEREVVREMYRNKVINWITLAVFCKTCGIKEELRIENRKIIGNFKQTLF